MLVVKDRKRDSKDPQRPSPDQLVHLFAKVGMDRPGWGFEAGQFALPGHIRAGAVSPLRVEEIRGLSGQEMVAAVMRHPQPDLLERQYCRRGARLGSARPAPHNRRESHNK